jgi:multiple sugar transport system substrate-binding protein
MLKFCKRIGISFLTAALLTSIVSGCGGGKQVGVAQTGAAQTASGSSSGSSKPVTITVMQQNAPDYVYFTNLGKEFTKLHPNVTVKFIGVPYDQFDSKLQTMIASGTQPDITTHVQLMGFMDYYNKGLLTDLTPYIQKYNFDYKKDNIPDNVMDMAKVDGKQWGIPLNSFTTVMMYNKDIFDKAGIAYPPSDYNDKSWTFDKMVEIAKKLTSGSGQNKTYGLYWNWNGGGAMQDPDYFGTSLFPADAAKTGRATSNNFSNSAVINAYQRIADLTFKDNISPTPAFVTALAGSNNSDPFLSGKIAMEVQAAWGLAGINDVAFKVGVAAVPIGPNPEIRNVLYTDPYFVLKGSKCPDEAFQFLAFLAQTDSQIKMIQQSGGEPPANLGALDTYYKNFKTVDEKDLKNVIAGSYQYGEEDLEHMIVGSGQIHDLLFNELSPVNNGTKTAQSVCVPLEKKLDNVLKDINKK